MAKSRKECKFAFPAAAVNKTESSDPTDAVMWMRADAATRNTNNTLNEAGVSQQDFVWDGEERSAGTAQKGGHLFAAVGLHCYFDRFF